MRRLQNIENSLDILICQDMIQHWNIDHDLRMALQHVQAAIDDVPTLGR